MISALAFAATTSNQPSYAGGNKFFGGFPGMSGGAILDEDGKLVGIHGRATTRPDTNATTVYGIPLKTYLSLAPSVQPVATAPAPNEINPQDADAYIKRGNVYYEQKKGELALADYNKAIAIAPQSAIAYNNRGLVYYEQKKGELALADYNKAIAINPQSAIAYYNRGIFYSERRDKQKAIEDLQKAANLSYEQGDTAAYQYTMNLLKDLQK